MDFGSRAAGDEILDFCDVGTDTLLLYIDLYHQYNYDHDDDHQHHQHHHMQDDAAGALAAWGPTHPNCSSQSLTSPSLPSSSSSICLEPSSS